MKPVLSYQEKWKIPNSKLVSRPMLVTVVGVNFVENQLKGTTSVYGNDSESYVAHVRRYQFDNIPNKLKCKQDKNFKV